MIKERLWATEKIQAAFRGRRGRKKWTKKRRRKDLYQAIKEEKESDEMEKEDALAFEIRQQILAASLLQRRWRGKKARLDFVFFKEEDNLDEEIDTTSRVKHRDDLKMNIEVKNRRDHLQWAGVWYFKQLHISKYVPGEGYCLVHGEWDKIKKLPITAKIMKNCVCIIHMYNYIYIFDMCDTRCNNIYLLSKMRVSIIANAMLC